MKEDHPKIRPPLNDLIPVTGDPVVLVVTSMLVTDVGDQMCW